MSKNLNLTKDQLKKGKIPGEDTGIEIKKSMCGICTGGCGVNAFVKDGIIVKVEGTLENPTNRGTLCSKGASNRQFVYHRDRIRTPMLKKGGKDSTEFEPISWEKAMAVFSSRLLEIREQSGPESVVFFTGYQKLFRPFLNRLALSFGSPNYCTESSVCFFATVAANKLNYGSGAGPDLKNAKCALIWSQNIFHSKTPAVAGLLGAKERGMKIIEVGPLITPLTPHADIHLQLRPGTTGALALSIAHVIIEEGLYDREFVENCTVGFQEYRDYAAQFPPAVAESITSVPAESIIRAARLYATTKPATMMNSASATVHHTNAIQNHRALTALIGLTGNFDRKGGNHVVPTSYYHTPNGLVTREQEFELVRPWDEMAPRIGQDKHPIWCDLVNEAQSMRVPFQIHSGEPYPVRAMVGFGVNYRMWPGSDHMREALKKLDFFVDTDLFLTDTARLADLVLPACTTFEKNELVISPARYAVWTQPVIRPLGDSRADIDIIIEMSKSLGLDDPIMHQGHEASLDWIYEPSGIKIADLKDFPAGRYLDDRSPTPYEKYKKDGFQTPSGKMEFASSRLKAAGYDPLPVYREPELSPISTPEIAEKYPLILNTGARLPMFMHSRAYRMGWTKALRPDPTVDINPRCAGERDINAGDWVELSSPRNAIRVKANLTERVPPGVVAMYHGHSDADVNLLIEPDYTDPISGYPGYKSLLCQVTKKLK